MEVRARMLSPLERALHLKSVELLHGLGPVELGLVAQRARERSFDPGEPLFEPGRRLASFHVVVEGSVRVRGGEHGEALVGPAGTVGLLCMLARWEEGMEAVAVEDTLTLEVDADHLADVLEDHFGVLHHEMRILARAMVAELQQVPERTELGPPPEKTDLGPPPEGIDLGLPREGSEFGPQPEKTHIASTPDIEPARGGDLDLVERLLFLRRATPLRRANMDALVEMARQAREVRFAAGEVLWDPGEPSGFMYLVVSGRVRGEYDPSRVFGLGPGYPVGNLESLAGDPRWFLARAETPLVVLRFETDAFLDQLEDHFEMAMDFLSMLATVVLRARARSRSPR